MDFEELLKSTENLKQIAVVTDEDFGITKQVHDTPPLTRLGARGIIINRHNQIAVFNKTKKNEFKLTGGGIEDGETPIVAFRRECREEAGVDITDIKLIGTVLEDKSQGNFKQLSYVFVARQKGHSKHLELTEKEANEGAKIIWMEPHEALQKMKDCLKYLKASDYDSIYRSQFMVLRDVKILQYYLDVLLKN